jgi:hypothetical protein
MAEPSVYETEYTHERLSSQCEHAPAGSLHWTAWLVLDIPGSKRLCRSPFECVCSPHAEQSLHGMAVSDEPVSTIRSNECGGVPTHTSAEK